MIKHAHLIGIKGVAMTALAVFLKEKGYIVTGSDVPDVFHTDAILKKCRISFASGFKPSHIPDRCDIVIATGAHGGMTNVEAIDARRRNIPTYMHGAYLGMLMDEKTGIAVSGCHGKTTTAALAAWIFSRAGLEPSYLVGTAQIPGLGAAGHWGDGKHLIAESDEYVTCPITDKTPRFLWQHPKTLIITNIDYDHPDVYPDLQSVKIAYLSFTRNVRTNGTIILCADDPNSMSIRKEIQAEVVTYGTDPHADVRISDMLFAGGESTMTISFKKKKVGRYTLHIPGKHNVLNAAAALTAGYANRIPWESMRSSLKSFQGTKRRFEKIGSSAGFLLYDDYAHHPEEIKATLQAATKWFPENQIFILFQPHTFSRTKRMLDEFSSSLSKADYVLVADIYASAREFPDNSINASMLVKGIRNRGGRAVYCPDTTHAVSFIRMHAHPGDVIMTMGAGDIYTWITEIGKKLRNKVVM